MKGSPNPLDGIENEIKEFLRSVGRDAVEYAKTYGDYRDRTGRLRASNRYKVDDEGLTLYNDAPYAAEVEARGYDVMSGAALYAEARIREGLQ